MHNIRIRTERLLLRPLKIDDAEDVFEWVSDERVSKYMVYTTYTDMEQVREWLAAVEQETDTYHFGFERTLDGKLIGSGDIGFDAQKNCWGFGYNFRYDCWGMNLASGNVMRKCGLHFTGYGEFKKLDGSVKMRSMEYEMEM